MTSAMISYCDVLQQARSTDDLWNIMHYELEEFGIKEMIYVAGNTVCFKNSDQLLNNIILKTSFTPAYMETKIHADSLKNDYFWQELVSRPKPIVWSETNVSQVGTPAQIASLKIDWDFKLTTGVTMPLKFANGLGIGGIGMSATGLSWKEFGKIWADKGDAIQALGTAFDIAMREDHIDEVFPLSMREKECLLWLAAGLRPQQIAHRLNTHSKTVEKQILSARKKLKADTVAQAVAKSLIFGLITP